MHTRGVQIIQKLLRPRHQMTTCGVGNAQFAVNSLFFLRHACNFRLTHALSEHPPEDKRICPAEKKFFQFFPHHALAVAVGKHVPCRHMFFGILEQRSVEIKYNRMHKTSYFAARMRAFRKTDRSGGAFSRPFISPVNVLPTHGYFAPAILL